MALASKNNDFISLIPPKVRLDLIKTIVKQPIQGPYGIFGATFNTYTSEGTLVRLFENIKEADIALFFDLIDGEVEVINKLFRGFNDFEWPFTDNNYQRFYAAFLKIYKKGKKLDEAALKAQFEASDDIIYLGDVVFPKRGYFEQNSGDITITDLWSRRSLVRVEIKNLKISWKIKYPDLRNAPHLLSDSLLRANYEIGEYEPIDIFEPIGVIISKKDGTGVKNEGIQILPAFALKYWYDFEEGKKLEAAASFVAFSALTALSAGSYGYATGAYKVLTCIDIFATAGEVAFSAYDANHPEIWNQTKDWEEFREAWRAGTAVLVSPLAVKFMVTDGPRLVTGIVKAVAKAPRAFSQGFDNFLNRLCKLYNVARGPLVLDPLAILIQRFKSLSIGLSDDLCRQFSSQVWSNLNIGSARLGIPDISDDFLRLIAQLPDDNARGFFITKFFSDGAKLRAFQANLKNTTFFTWIKNGERNECYKAWESLFSSPLLSGDVVWLNAVVEWQRVGLILNHIGNGDFEILSGGIKIGLIKNRTLLSLVFIKAYPTNNPVGPAINGCQAFEDAGRVRILRVPDTSPYNDEQLKWLQGDPGAHCLEKHGPDVSEEALIYRAVTGTAANGDTKSIVHSSKFYSSEEIKFALSKVNPETELFFEFVDPNNPGFVVVKAYLGKSLGYGYRKSSSAILPPTLEGNINSIIAVWKQKPTGDWYLITMYPSIL